MKRQNPADKDDKKAEEGGPEENEEPQAEAEEEEDAGVERTQRNQEAPQKRSRKENEEKPKGTRTGRLAREKRQGQTEHKNNPGRMPTRTPRRDAKIEEAKGKKMQATRENPGTQGSERKHHSRNNTGHRPKDTNQTARGETRERGPPG